MNWGAQIIEADPAFIAPPTDYHLSFQSACLDAVITRGFRKMVWMSMRMMIRWKRCRGT